MKKRRESEPAKGGVYKRKDTASFYIWYYDSRGKRLCRTSGAQTKGEAYIILNRIQKEIKRGQTPTLPGDHGSPVGKELIARLSEQERSKQKAAQTVYTDLTRIRRFIEFCREQDVRFIEEIDSAILDRFLHWIPERYGVSHVTANRYLDAVRGVLPVKISVKKFPENPGRGREIPGELLSQILAAADPIFRVFLTLLAETGLRTGHLCIAELEWIKTYKIDTADGPKKATFINFPPGAYRKSKRAPLTPLNKCSIKVIQSLSCKGPVYLFDKGDGRQLYTKDRVYDRWRTIKQKVGFEGYRPYDLRHTFAIKEVLRTGNFAYVAQRLGNLPTTTLEYYQNLSDTRIFELAAGTNITGDVEED